MAVGLGACAVALSRQQTLANSSDTEILENIASQFLVARDYRSRTRSRKRVKA